MQSQITICSQHDCLRPIHSRGLCKLHYERARISNSITVTHWPSVDERFDAKVERRGPNECWPWLAGKNEKGYGQFRPHGGGRMVRAHQYAYVRAYGSIPEGLEVDHICEQRDCQNPRHLRAVTHQQNISHGRTIAAMYARRTHCGHGHEYTSENTVVRISQYGRPYRRCRTCERAGKRKR